MTHSLGTLEHSTADGHGDEQESSTESAARSTTDSHSVEPRSMQQRQDTSCVLPAGLPVDAADTIAMMRCLGLADSSHGGLGSSQSPATVNELEAALEGCPVDADGSDLEAAVAAALQGLLEQRSLHPANLCTLIDGVSGTSRWRLGVAVFKAMTGIVMPVRRCRDCGIAALRACSHSRDAHAAWEVYKLMSSGRMCPDSRTYSALIPLLIESGDLTSGLECYTDAIARGCGLSAATCMCLLAALQREGQWREAEAALVCALPAAPFQALAEDLYWPPDPDAAHATPALIRIQTESLKYVEPLVAVQLPCLAAAAGTLDGQGRGGTGLNSKLCSSTRTTFHVKGAFFGTDSSSESDSDDGDPHSAGDGSGDDEDGNMPQLLGHVPLYLLGTEQAQQACRIVLEMYRDASPPQAARGRALVATMSQAHAQGFVPVPHDSAYQLLVDTHIGLGSSSEAWALLHFLAHAAWQPPDAAFMSLLATACGTESYGVPQVWLAFKLRGALPGGVCCNCFIAAAAAASTPGSDSGDDRSGTTSDGSAAAAPPSDADPRVRMAWEAATMQAALSRGDAPDSIAIFHQLLEAGVRLSWRTVADVCDRVQRERGQLQCCRARLRGCAATGPRQHCC